MVFGELAPKTFAIQSAEGTSLFVAPFMRFFYYLLLPVTVVFNGTANAITGALGMPPASEGDETHSEDEIRNLVAQSARQGMLERDEEGRLARSSSSRTRRRGRSWSPAPTSSPSPKERG